MLILAPLIRTPVTTPRLHRFTYNAARAEAWRGPGQIPEYNLFFISLLGEYHCRRVPNVLAQGLVETLSGFSCASKINRFEGLRARQRNN